MVFYHSLLLQAFQKIGHQDTKKDLPEVLCKFKLLYQTMSVLLVVLDNIIYHKSGSVSFVLCHLYESFLYLDLVITCRGTCIIVYFTHTLLFSEHQCLTPGCNNTLVLDGNMKNHRCVCSATHAGYTAYKGLPGKVRSGCQNTPAYESSYCDLHKPVSNASTNETRGRNKHHSKNCRGTSGYYHQQEENKEFYIVSGIQLLNWLHIIIQ